MSIEARINTVVDAIIACRKDPEQMSIAIEKLSKALGFAVSMAAKGDPKTIDELLVGAEKYAHESAVENAGLASLASLEAKAND